MTSTGVNIGFSYGEKSSSKVLKPPGGECSDIFGTSNASFRGRSQGKQLHSSIFETDSAPMANNQSPTARRDSDTQNRLFGTTASEESSPRRIVDRMKSNVFAEEETNTNHSTKKQVRRNTITGEILDDDDDENEENILQNGNGNGNPVTGDGNVVSTNQAPFIKVRNPPGGKSSGIF